MKKSRIIRTIREHEADAKECMERWHELLPNAPQRRILWDSARESFNAARNLRMKLDGMT